jgi:hypothetical protein
MRIFDAWTDSRAVVMIVNVAQELSDPFHPHEGTGLPVYPAAYGAIADRPAVEYVHAPWSHGESGLARDDERRGGQLGFQQLIDWLESGRKRGLPILIQ